MSTAPAMHAVQPPVHATAPPAQRKAEALDAVADRPQRLLASLTSVPAIQRTCAACNTSDEDRRMPVQPRLEVGPVDDPYEREADQIAGQVMAMRQPAVQRIGDDDEESTEDSVQARRSSTIAPAVQRDIDPEDEVSDGSVQPRRAAIQRQSAEVGDEIDDSVMPRRASLQRKCAACTSEDEMPVQPSRASASVQRASAPLLETDPLRDMEDMPRMKPDQADAGTEQIAASAAQLTSGGSPLSDTTREFFESRMGRDLADVRLHSGSASDALNEGISSRSFTYQNHIWLGRGETEHPSFTMAHELAHVLQQTQPGPVPEALARRAPPTVQRNFWQQLGSSNVGTETTLRHQRIHDNFQDDIQNSNRSIFLEVPIPGATRRNSYQTACGFADLFKSDNNAVPGLEVDTASPIGLRRINWRGNCRGHWFRHMTAAQSRRHQRNAYPRLNRQRSQVTQCGRAPINIRVGDVKPGHNESERESGQEQVARYVRGLRDNAALINAQSPGCYTPSPDILTTLTIPPNWDPGRGGDWTIRELEFRRTQLGRPRVFRPFGTRRGRGGSLGRIRGRYSGVKDPRFTQGIWTYFIEPHPDDLAAALGRSSSRRSGFTAVARDLQRILNCLRSTPANSQRLCRRPAAAHPDNRHSPRQRLPLARQRDTGMRVRRQNMRRRTQDRFDRARWDAMRRGGAAAPQYANDNLRSTLGREFTEEQQETVLFQGAVVEGKDDFDHNFGRRNTFDVPQTALSARPGGIRDNARTIGRAQFWAGELPIVGDVAGIFGRLRARLGGAFARAADTYERVKERARRAFRNRSFRGGSQSALAVAAKKAAGMVLRTIGTALLKRIGSNVIDCLETGFSRYISRQVEGTGVDELVEKARSAQARMADLRDDLFGNLEAMGEQIIAPVRARLEEITQSARVVFEVVDAATTIAHGLRIGLCLAGISAAGVGEVVTCLLSLGDFILSQFGASPIDWLAGKLIKTCESQRLISRAMLGFDIVRRLPVWLTREIVTRLRNALPDSLRDIFCNPDDIEVEDLTVAELDCNEGIRYANELHGEIASETSRSGVEVIAPDRRRDEGSSHDMEEAVASGESPGGNPILEQDPQAGTERGEEAGGTGEGDQTGQPQERTRVEEGVIENPSEIVDTLIEVYLGSSSALSPGPQPAREAVTASVTMLVLSTGQRFGPVRLPIIPVRVEPHEHVGQVLYFRPDRNYLLRKRDYTMSLTATEHVAVLRQGQ